jgi:hypothetical protein
MPATPLRYIHMRLLWVLMSYLYCLPVLAQPLQNQVTQAQPLTWLKAEQYPLLDNYFGKLQADFEAGNIPDEQLFQSYHALYEDNLANSRYFDKWIQTSPNSYAARVARGAFYYRMAWAKRGGDFLTNHDVLSNAA